MSLYHHLWNCLRNASKLRPANLLFDYSKGSHRCFLLCYATLPSWCQCWEYWNSMLPTGSAFLQLHHIPTTLTTNQANNTRHDPLHTFMVRSSAFLICCCKVLVTESIGLRYTDHVMCLLFWIGSLHLIAVWYCEDERANTTKIHVLKRLDNVFKFYKVLHTQ